MRRLSTRQRLAAIVLAVVAVGFVVLDAAGGGLRSAHDGVRGTLGALYRGTDAVLGPVRRFVQAVPHAAGDADRIQRLQDENAALRRRLTDAATDRATAGRLRALQLSANALHRDVVPARVIAFGPGQGFDWTITVDAGTGDGARAGQTVTDGAALVGRVVHADRSSATVLLAADPGSGVGVRDTRTGELGVVTGRGTAGYTLRPVRPCASDCAAVVAVGDRLVTGPMGGSTYAPGIAVGRVTAVRSAADGTLTATVAPAVSATALDVVGLVVGPGDRALTAGSRPALHPRHRTHR